ncbi:hypothetical protein KSF78_0004479 [Schistosoma japonicum]|nr:hypothetical protein KSF78_0004479 [Schistosoma japonicum]
MSNSQHELLSNMDNDDDDVVHCDDDDDDDDDNPDKEYNFMINGLCKQNIKSRKLLIKICIILCINISITILCTILFNNITQIKKVLDEQSWISPVFGIQALLFGELLFVVPYSLSRSPWRYILLGMIALTSGVVISTFSILPSNVWSLLSWCIASMLYIVFFIVGLRIYYDVTRLWHYIIVFTIMMIFLGFAVSVVGNHILGGIYLVTSIPCTICEGQMIQGGKLIKFKNKQYIIASIMCWFTLTCTYFGVLFQLSDYNFFLSYILNP